MTQAQVNTAAQDSHDAEAAYIEVESAQTLSAWRSKYKAYQNALDACPDCTPPSPVPNPPPPTP